MNRGYFAEKEKKNKKKKVKKKYFQRKEFSIYGVYK
jgi:hypothetical protein